MKVGVALKFEGPLRASLLGAEVVDGLKANEDDIQGRTDYQELEIVISGQECQNQKRGLLRKWYNTKCAIGPVLGKGKDR